MTFLGKHSKSFVVLFSYLIVVPHSLVWAISANPINFYYLSGVNEQVYGKPGDINLGALDRILHVGKPHGEVCSRGLKSSAYVTELSEANAFAVDLVNRNPHLLPNVTLGFISRPVCNSRNVGLASSLAFLPRSDRVCNTNGSLCETRPLLSPIDTDWLNHDVVGVLSQGYSSVALSISYLYAVANLPMVSIGESSDDLSYKRDHPYFFRIVPPNKYQIKALLRFLSTNRWVYISVIYTEGWYGESAFKRLKQIAGDYGVCLASTQILLPDTDYYKLVGNLLLYPRARVVVLFLTGKRFKSILEQVINHNSTGHFVWVGSDSINSYKGVDSTLPSQDPSIGAFSFDYFTSYIDEFYDHIRKQRVETTTNPWLKANYEYILGCSYDKGTCDMEADVLQSFRYKITKNAPVRIDAVLTFAHALHSLLSDRCPGARGKEARACVTGKLFREYLQRVDFEGYNGRIKFDANQDVKGGFKLSQFVYDSYNYPFRNKTDWKFITQKTIAVFDVSEDTISYLNKPITWSHLDVLERIVPWTHGSLPIEIPESVCSRPCVTGEYKIEKEVPCCWECRRCRDNERLVHGNNGCQACPSFTWPDPDSGFVSCIDINPSYLKFNDTVPIVLNIFAILCLITTIGISVCYLIYRNERVIKASSKELSVLQLAAILSGYATVILFQTKPTDTMCNIIFFTFCMSFAMLYCPLLVKTVRIYRIFKSGAKNEQPRFISPMSQFTLALCLITVQVTLCAVTYILYTPAARLTQPIWTEKFVELSCDLTLPGTASFLGYNIILVSLCSGVAFMVRKLPDNFNESKFISMSVSMALLIWLAFIPTYFTADREYIRVFLLSMALLINHSVALFLLFAPKIYAAVILPSDSGNFSNARS